MRWFFFLGWSTTLFFYNCQKVSRGPATGVPLGMSRGGPRAPAQLNKHSHDSIKKSPALGGSVPILSEIKKCWLNTILFIPKNLYSFGLFVQEPTRMSEYRTKMDIDEIESTYMMIRYFILADGTLCRYFKNYANREIRRRRLFFLEYKLYDQETADFLDYLFNRHG